MSGSLSDEFELSDVESWEDEPDCGLEEDLLDGDDQGRSQSYEVLSAEGVIEEVKELLCLSSRSQAAKILRCYHWNKEKLLSDFFSGATASCILDGGEYEEEDALGTEWTIDKPGTFECGICMEDVPYRSSHALSCGHRYCEDCWVGYMTTAISEEGQNCAQTQCPFPDCTKIVKPSHVRDLVPEELFLKYQKFVFMSLVADIDSLKFCPAPDCSNCIKVELHKTRVLPVKCTCGFSFCFRCADYDIGDHTPATCQNVEDWMAKAADESENVKWMLANCKKCPKCRKPIEKNGGCMHMVCRAGGCSYEFCWLCRGPWSEHSSETGGYYACNKYNASSAKKEDETAANIKTELDAYMFYFHRYESHHNAMKIANAQRRNAETKSSDLMDRFGVRPQDTKFLMEATEQLLDNRRCLKYSYVYGYYLKSPAEKSLFEYLQEDLEKHTNTLSELYERNLDDFKGNFGEFSKWKETVTNYVRVTSGFLDKFVRGVAQGLDVLH